MIELGPLGDVATRPTQMERAELVTTTLGVAGAVVCTPAKPGPLGVLILQGLETNRSGVNAVWTRTARALAGVGVAALRVDYPGIGDSAGIPGGKESHRPMLAEVVAWFRETSGLERVGGIAACYGAKPVLSLAAGDALDGPIALVTPALGRPFSRRPLGRFGHRVRRRFGQHEPLDRSVLRDLEQVAGREPVAVLLGELDRQAVAALASTRRRLGGHAAIAEQVVPGERLHGFPSARGQAEAVARLSSWARAAADATMAASRAAG